MIICSWNSCSRSQRGRSEARFFALVEEFGLSAHRWPVVQEQLRGRKFKFDGVFRDGESGATNVFEILRCKGANKFRTPTFRVTVDAPEDLTQHAIQALKALHRHGMFNTDWICDEYGIAHLIDINGRLIGAVAVPYEARYVPFLDLVPGVGGHGGD